MKEHLEQPCKDKIYTSNNFSSFLELIYTRENVFKYPEVRKLFSRGLHLKPADRENIEREAGRKGNLCKLMLEQSFLAKGSKINCLFDVVRALLKTKARISSEKKDSKKAKRIQKLLDDLGNHLEEILFAVDDILCEDDVW